jgi:hypothetical protein
MVTANQRGRNPTQVRQIFYGQLECILDVTLPVSRTPLIPTATRFLLAVVRPCLTGGKDATREVTMYAATTVPVVIDIRTVENVVGRVRRGNEWGIVDRSGDFARTVFVDPEVDNG